MKGKDESEGEGEGERNLGGLGFRQRISVKIDEYVRNERRWRGPCFKTGF